MIIGGVEPVVKKISLPNEAELRAKYFLERRELGIINVGGKGMVTADGKEYEIEKLECVYLGKGTKAVSFSSVSKKNRHIFIYLSVPAHHTYPNKKMTKKKPHRLIWVKLLLLIKEPFTNTFIMMA